MSEAMMRIAILDSWPNLPENAEREFLARFEIACANVGIECNIVVTSDDICACDPDVVLVFFGMIPTESVHFSHMTATLSQTTLFVCIWRTFSQD